MIENRPDPGERKPRRHPSGWPILGKEEIDQEIERLGLDKTNNKHRGIAIMSLVMNMSDGEENETT